MDFLLHIRDVFSERSGIIVFASTSLITLGVIDHIMVCRFNKPWKPASLAASVLGSCLIGINFAWDTDRIVSIVHHIIPQLP